MSYKPEVDIEKCSGCGTCVDICPVEVYELHDKISVSVNDEDCIGCESCVEACRQGAITIIEI